MVERTKRDIINAFNRLIKVKDIQKISVEQIIHEANISKATFYRYFVDKYDVMNANYKELLDHLASPEISSSYLDLYENLFKYGIKNWKFLQRALETVGRNSFCDFISVYSLELVKTITKLNRDGKGFTAEEQLQSDVYSIGVGIMYRNWIYEKYPLTPHEAALALYEIMPKDLRDYWWTDQSASIKK